jgi:uncharacterized protein with von Willebrand factor type A (vWA) domain
MVKTDHARQKVAMALAELITTRYPKDTLDILVFGNDAWTIAIKDLPYLVPGIPIRWRVLR